MCLKQRKQKLWKQNSRDLIKCHIKMKSWFLKLSCFATQIVLLRLVKNKHYFNSFDPLTPSNERHKDILILMIDLMTYNWLWEVTTVGQKIT